MSAETADLLKFVLSLVFGTGAGWVGSLIRQRRKDKAERADKAKADAKDEAERPDREDRAAIAITEQLQALTKGAITEVEKRLDAMHEALDAVQDALDAERAKTNRQGARIALLEKVLHDHGIESPPEPG